MKIIFNELGVITSIDTTDEPIRQGNVGVNNLIVDFSNMNGVNNLDYACVFTYVRPDKSKINDVIMLSSAENTKYFEFNFSNKWFFELYGDASITVKLLKNNTVLANGEFNIVIEKTSADNEPQITYDEYLHLVESIAKTQQDAKQYTDDSVQALKNAVAENYAEKTYVDNQLNLCVKLTDIDTDFSLTSTNPLQNKVVSKQIKDINYTIMTIKEELFETILSEVDYKVDYATIYSIPETLSDDDGTHRVVYSDTQLKEIEGNSVAFNQLANITGTSETINGITFTNNGDGSWTISGVATENIYKPLNTVITIKTHRFLVKGATSKVGLYVYDKAVMNSDQIFTYNGNTVNNYLLFYIASGTDISTPIKVIPQLFNLSFIEQSGKTYSSVEEFNRIFPLTYYPYNAGEIKSTVIKGVNVNGYNMWDYNNVEIGYISNGYNMELKHCIRTPNYISVKGGTSYTLSCNSENFNQPIITEYDENKNFIRQNYNSGSSVSAILTNETKFVRLTFSNNSNQIDYSVIGLPTSSDSGACFHLTGSRTGYAPYKEPRIIAIPQTELPSAGSVHDTIKFVEGNIVAGQQRYNMVQVNRVNSVDLGTLNWTWQSANNRWFTSNLSTLVKAPTSNDNKANIIAEKYEILSFTNANTNSKGMALTNSGNLFYYTSDSTNAPSGILNYEKAEPTETTLATDLTFEEVSAIIEQGGSIETVFEIVPPNLKTAFVVNKAIVS